MQLLQVRDYLISHRQGHAMDHESGYIQSAYYDQPLETIKIIGASSIFAKRWLNEHVNTRAFFHGIVR
jgi:hypothetical protein